MSFTSSLLFVCLAICLPAVVIWLVHRFAWAAKLGVVVLCYVAGLSLGSTGLLPVALLPVQSTVSEAAIALALPLVLMSLDVVAWSKVASRALLSMGLAMLSVLAVSSVMAMTIAGLGVDKVYELAGLAVGVYTGGTPNLAAIKTALGVDNTRFLVFVAFDTVIGALFLMFMLSVGKPLFARLLPAPMPAVEGNTDELHDTHNEDFGMLLERRHYAGIVKGTVVAGAVVIAAIGVSRMLGKGESTAVVIALLTTMAILVSFLPPVRRIGESYKVGMYLIYVFSFVVASMVRLSDVRVTDLKILAFITLTVTGSLVLHAMLCRLTRVDVDTFLVTSVGAVCSPPFVPMMARALGNPTVILSGMTTGVIGYALGTYLGISLGLLLKNFL